MHKKALFIDWNGTLSHSKFWEQLIHQGNKKHRYYDKITEWLFKQNYDIIDKWMLGKVSSEDVCHSLSNSTQIDYDLIFDELIYSCENMTFVSKEIASLIKKIRDNGRKCIIASDNMDTFRRYTIPSLSLDEIFDDFLISYELGRYKYDYDNNSNSLPFFDEFLQKHKLSYKDVVLIDDSVERSGHFKKLGFEIHYVDKYNSLNKILEKYATN